MWSLALFSWVILVKSIQLIDLLYLVYEMGKIMPTAFPTKLWELDYIDCKYLDNDKAWLKIIEIKLFYFAT